MVGSTLVKGLCLFSLEGLQLEGGARWIPMGAAVLGMLPGACGPTLRCSLCPLFSRLQPGLWFEANVVRDEPAGGSPRLYQC